MDINTSQYRQVAHFNVTHRRRQNFYGLPTSHWQMLAAPPFNFLSTLDRVDDAIDANADIASEILAAGLQSFNLGIEPKDPALDWRGTATASDVDKARITIRQLHRDWSAESFEERQSCYDIVLHDVHNIFEPATDKSQIKILIPGAGLGRLVFEYYLRGYTVEGNEISYHQLIAGNWALNHIKPSQQFDLYPFALEFSNVISRDHQLKSFKIPDIHARTVLAAEYKEQHSGSLNRMTMTAADFIAQYRHIGYGGKFDAVVTVFFIDTAPNVIRYIEVIRHCLKSGGTWINIGPLLWHFSERRPMNLNDEGAKTRSPQNGIDEPGSMELSVEEVLLLVASAGFEIEKQEVLDKGFGYIHNTESMLQNTYKTIHWIAKKK